MTEDKETANAVEDDAEDSAEDDDGEDVGRVETGAIVVEDDA